MKETGPIKKFALGIYDGPHATPKESDEGPVYLGINNVTSDGRLDFSEIRHISEEEFPKWIRRVLPQKDDLVFSYEATLHRYALIPDNLLCCLGRRMCLVRPDQEKVYPRFLLYYFLSSKWRAVIESNIVSGATVDRIPIKRFPDFEITLPPLDAQRRIADAIAAYDDLIENNRRRIDLLEQSARMLYKEWFVSLRFPGHEHVKVKNGVPEGWEKTTLGEIAPLNYGKGLKADERIPGAYPVYGSSGIVGTHEKALVGGPGIIVGRKGNAGSAFWSMNDFYPIDTTYYIESSLSSYFLYYLLLNTQFVSSDVAVPGLNRDYAHNLKILLPPKNLLSLFEANAESIRKQIFTLEKYSETLTQARDLLLPRLMNGEIAV